MCAIVVDGTMRIIFEELFCFLRNFKGTFVFLGCTSLVCPSSVTYQDTLKHLVLKYLVEFELSKDFSIPCTILVHMTTLRKYFNTF